MKNLQDFINEICNLYTKAREFTYEKNLKNIERGRNHPISSRAEDLFTLILSNNLSKKLSYRIDQPMTVAGKTIYPDIAIIENDVVLNFIELKLDIGWNRNEFHEYLKNLDKKMKIIQNQEATMKHGITKMRKSLRISKKCKNHTVIVSGTNIKENLLDSHITKAKSLENTHLYVLSEHVHPNTYKFSTNEIKINEFEFKRLIKNLKQ